MRKNLIALAALFALLAGALVAQNSPGSDKELGAAQAKIASGDFAGATAILEKVAAADPKNQLVWRYLGFAYLKQKNDLGGLTPSRAWLTT